MIFQDPEKAGLFQPRATSRRALFLRVLGRPCKATKKRKEKRDQRAPLPRLTCSSDHQTGSLCKTHERVQHLKLHANWWLVWKRGIESLIYLAPVPTATTKFFGQSESSPPWVLHSLKVELPFLSLSEHPDSQRGSQDCFALPKLLQELPNLLVVSRE